MPSGDNLAVAFTKVERHPDRSQGPCSLSTPGLLADHSRSGFRGAISQGMSPSGQTESHPRTAAARTGEVQSMAAETTLSQVRSEIRPSGV